MKFLMLAAFLMSGDPAPKFEAVDAHVAAKTANAFPRTGLVRAGRYEVKNATIVDLVRIAYGFDADKVYGGPNWIEMDRFDVIGKVPADSNAESHKQMLQAALEERFGLAVHKDTKPLPVFVLSAGKKPQLKEAAGTEESGCKPQSASAAPPPPGEGGGGAVRLMMSSNNGPPITLDLGPGMTVQYHCRNMTMQAFAAGLRTMIGTSLSNGTITDETGIKGGWNFDLKYSMQMMGPMMGDTGGRISIYEAIEKQLGLKLEERQLPTPVIVVDKVNRTPSPNPPETSVALPPIPVPTEFEVATIKPVTGGMGPGMTMMRYSMQPGGRLVSEGMPLQFLLSRAFNTNNNEMIVGMPSFGSDRYELIAKVPGASGSNIDADVVAPMLLNLLKERFGLKYHTEDREVSAYSLMAAKPKMKKADPESRTFCKTPPPSSGTPPGSRVLTCQNVTMAQFAERLQNLSPELSWPVADATGLEGGWDLTLTFSMARPMMVGMPGMMAGRAAEGGGGGGAAMPSASDPTGGVTIFSAIEKQLGLKLEKEKRKAPVFVIDHIEQKPIEN
jgi:uncharacterized protein (TIGR03435 family)